LTEDIKESSTRLIGIVNDYLELSSLEQGRLVLQPDKLDLTELMQQVVRENQSLALEKNLKLSFVQPRTPHLFVRADPNRTRQVIENLISNAVHYTNKGTVKIELVKTGQYITCRVRDTGIGIAKTSQKQLFGKFRQAQENLLTRDPMRSTGLGLYITKLMVEKMGGKIVLEHSALGKGSVFAFTLPVAERSAGSSRASKPLQLR
jgi:signal transduction histidine kinase